MNDLARDGLSLVSEALRGAGLERLRSVFDAASSASSHQRGRARYGRRNVLTEVPELARLAASDGLRALVEPRLPGARAVRCLLFDKVPGANWPVAWHQDRTIAVAEKREVPGYSLWTIKAGCFHVQPPAAVLEAMVTVRLHLDDCGDDNGPLRVAPGSHTRGILAPAQVEEVVAGSRVVVCSARAGDALLMRPLLLHSSFRAGKPSRRRVVHIEYAAGALPGGLRWAVGP